MALVTADRVKETTTVTTGTATLLGAATGFQSFAVIGNANTTYYCIAGQGTSEWEVGIGTYSTSGTTLARTTILATSSASQPTALTFSAGTKDVFVTYPSSKGVYLDASGNVNINGTVGATTPAAGSFTNITGSANAIISVTDNTNAALRITQLGSGNALLVEDSTNPDATPFVVNANGTSLFGQPTKYNTATTSNPRVQVEHEFTLGFFDVSANPARFEFAKSRSATVGDITGTVLNNDSLGEIDWQGSDGTNLVRGAAISASVDGTPGTNDMPGRLVFSTTADGGSSPTERMRIDSNGNVGIGATPAAGQNLNVGKNLTGSASAYGPWCFGTIQSDVTSQANLFQTTAVTAAAAFTLTTLNHYGTFQSAFGVGSTVTNQRGFYANSALTGATNNYGFYGDIASGTGRYNLYMSGTAANYLGGATTFNAAITYGGITLTNAVTGTGKMVLDTTPTIATPVLTNPTITSYVETSPTQVTVGAGTTALDLTLSTGTVLRYILTATQATTFTMPTATAGKSFVMLLKQAAATGNGTATFTSVKWGTAGAPTITATAGKMDILTFIADGTNWYGSIAQGYTP